MFNPNDNKFDKLDKVFEPFPAGRHLVFVSDAKPFVAKSGSTAVEFEFTIHDPASAYRGKTLRFARFWLGEKSLWRLARLCRSCSNPVGPFDPNDARSVEDALLDRILVIEVEHKQEVYEGKQRTREEVKSTEQPTKQDLARLLEEFGESLLPPVSDEDGFEDGPIDSPTSRSAGYGGAGPTIAPQPGNDDTDIPF
jgi:hypothetical protein